MEQIRHINYKSDFILRERFRNGDGSFVALPDVDFKIEYRTKHGNTFTASRTKGIYRTAPRTGMHCWLFLKTTDFVKVI